MNKQITQNEALQILIGAANAGQAKGAYTLQDAELISQAIKMFMPPSGEVKPEESKEDNTKQPKK